MIHDVFVIAHYIKYFNYRNLVWILYPDLDFSHLPLFGMDVILFFLDTHKEKLYQFPMFIIPHHASGEVSSLVIESLNDVGA